MITLPSSDPNILLFFLSPKNKYRSPLFSENEIFCGPDAEDEMDTDGNIKAIKTNIGRVDVTAILNRLPLSQKPEIIVVKADATRRCFPYNLNQCDCSKVLIVGDTHHLKEPITTVIGYALSEPFDYVIFDHTRHHAHLFAQAGVKNLYWLPALDYSFIEGVTISEDFLYPLSFVGQVGRYHPYRVWIIEHLKKSNIPIHVLQGTLEQTAYIYSKSLITLNISLNGDLNLRTFEALAAGGFLLTDSLKESSGLGQLFTPGVHLDTWSDSNELIDKIKFYTSNPSKVLEIKRNAYKYLYEKHHPKVKNKEFLELIFLNKIEDKYNLNLDFKCINAVSLKAVKSEIYNAERIKEYEIIQELHRTNLYLNIYCLNKVIGEYFDDLPRLNILSIDDLLSNISLNHSIIWLNDLNCTNIYKILDVFSGPIVCASSSKFILDIICNYGYTQSQDTDGLYHQTLPGKALEYIFNRNPIALTVYRLKQGLQVTTNSEDCFILAKLADKISNSEFKVQALARAIGLDRFNYPALLLYAEHFLNTNIFINALVLFEEANRVRKLDDAYQVIRNNLLEKCLHETSAKEYYSLISGSSLEITNNVKTILVITNLFPPQELGGYGRKMWEFSWLLKKKGYRLIILTSDMPEIAKNPSADEHELELLVKRNIKLLGTWNKGVPTAISSVEELRCRLDSNNKVITDVLVNNKIDFALVGNMDFLGIDTINLLLRNNIKVVHALGNNNPGYPVTMQPTSKNYKIGCCSGWIAKQLKLSGYNIDSFVLYPGARTDLFYRLFLPDVDSLRICFAGLVMPYKGVQTLISALAILKSSNVKFSAIIAGELGQDKFIAELRDIVENNNMSNQVCFSGFLDRHGMNTLFAKCNILVFPSIFDEPFGISQVEAMSSGLVVISSGTGGSNEIIRDGVDGLLFTRNDSLDLAKKIVQLYSDKKLFKQLQLNSQKRAIEFDVKISVSKIEACL